MKKVNLKILMATCLFATAQADAARAYPIDCAILLCMAGGFPPSAECTAAKAVMIQRITPFPIEPPLQIWNCPMGGPSITSGSSGSADISGPDFDFVRSIKVWHVQNYIHHDNGEHGCRLQESVAVGSYDAVGDYRWTQSSYDQTPDFVIPQKTCSEPGTHANSRRGVGLEWTDHTGNPSNEWVSY